MTVQGGRGEGPPVPLLEYVRESNARRLVLRVLGPADVELEQTIAGVPIPPPLLLDAADLQWLLVTAGPAARAAMRQAERATDPARAARP